MSRPPKSKLGTAALGAFRALCHIGGEKGDKTQWAGVSTKERQADAHTAASTREGEPWT